uniref:Uncharacterized protein n=1 Tax=Anguilla anguilla TaxID=7936 RepID=A0A0E9R8P0_ANGAN
MIYCILLKPHYARNSYCMYALTNTCPIFTTKEFQLDRPA